MGDTCWRGCDKRGHAVEGHPPRGPKTQVYRSASERRAQHGRTVPHVRDQHQNRIQVVASVRAGGHAGPARPKSGEPQPSQCHGRGSWSRSSSAPVAGTRPGVLASFGRGCEQGLRAACTEHHRRYSAPGRACAAQAPPATAWLLCGRPECAGPAQRRVGRRLQRALQAAQRPKCYPLTISDGFSRYLLRCEALRHQTGSPPDVVFDAAFAEFGLPWTLRTDNGTPFSAAHGISELTVWWIQLGIEPNASSAASQRRTADMNACTERSSKTPSSRSSRPAASGPAAHLRSLPARVQRGAPHEALSDRAPASCYEPSPRRYQPSFANPSTVMTSWCTGSSPTVRSRMRAETSSCPLRFAENRSGS